MINDPISRRRAIGVWMTATGATLLTGTGGFGQSPPSGRSAPTLGFSTYGMKSLRTEDAIRQLSNIGFEAVELTVRPDWDAAPDRMPAARRKDLAKLIVDQGMRLSSLMEHIIPDKSDAKHKKQLEQLRSVVELGRDLFPDDPPVVQTVLGGGKWDEKREFLVGRMKQWLEIADDQGIVIAIKPHRGGAMSRPSEAIWIMKELGFPERLKMVYDYSHYAFRDMEMDQTIAESLPHTAHVAVKDAVKTADRIVFDLPGQHGTTDFASLIKQFRAGGYVGDINCEVSSMVWRQSGYDPVGSAQKCFDAMSKAFAQSK